MQHPIDPKIDCVFKAILGTQANRNLLIHFLNAILDIDLSAPIIQVDILNPYNEREFVTNKLSIVDVKAQDQHGQLYQIEIQLLSYKYLPERILYTWADLYTKQLRSGQNYRRLRPTYAIWLLAENLIEDDAAYAHIYQLRDVQGRSLLHHGGIWLLELSKFMTAQIETKQQRWLKFFQDGEHLDEANLPTWMQTAEMRQAMETLRQFSDKDREYHAYQARQNYLREQETIQIELEEYRQEIKALQLEKDAAIQQEKEAAQREKDAAIQQEKEAAQREKDAAIQQEKEAAQREKDAIHREAQAEN